MVGFEGLGKLGGGEIIIIIIIIMTSSGIEPVTFQPVKVPEPNCSLENCTLRTI
jgi:hypothetical protein